MTDIVERLRKSAVRDGFAIILKQHVDEAAAEIERLREQVASLQASSGYEASIAQVEIERLTAALRAVVDYPHCGPMILRAIARAALEPKP